MSLEKRINKIQNTHDETVLKTTSNVRIDNKMLGITNKNPFNNTAQKQQRLLVNQQLNMFYNIYLEAEGSSTYKVRIDYGTIGNKCKVPVVGSYEDMNLAVNECNNRMREHLSKGYAFK